MARGVWLALAVTLAPCAPGAWAAAAVQASEQEACAAKPMAGQTSSLMQRAETTMQSKMSGKLEVSHKASVDLIADEDFSTTHAEALVESLAEKVTLQNYTMTDTEQEALKTIKSMVEKMINSTYNQHGEDQWEVTVARDLIENCTNESKLDQVDSLKQTTETKRGEHEVCRMAQKTIWHSSKDKCIEYDRTRKSGEYKNAPSCMVGTPSHLAADYIATEDASKKEKMESCLEDVNDWFWPIYGNYTTCKGSQDELEEKKTQCNSAQDVFERSFCAYASQLSTECQSQEDCRQNAIGHFNRTVEQVEVTAKARRAEFTAGHRIQCFFRIFNATDAEKKNVLDECKNKTVDTGNLTIVVPSIPDAATCTPEANQPCDAQWENVEYKDKDWYPDAPTTACKPCVVPSPTPAPTQVPSPTPAPTQAAIHSTGCFESLRDCMLVDGAVCSLTNDIVVSADAESGGLFVPIGQRITILGNGFTIDGQKLYQIMVSRGDLALYDSRLVRGRAELHGGALRVYGDGANLVVAHLTVRNTEFSDNIGEYSAGALMCHAAASCHLENCVFKNNIGKRTAGAVRIQGCPFTGRNLKFLGNRVISAHSINSFCGSGALEESRRCYSHSSNSEWRAKQESLFYNGQQPPSNGCHAFQCENCHFAENTCCSDFRYCGLVRGLNTNGWPYMDPGVPQEGPTNMSVTEGTDQNGGPISYTDPAVLLHPSDWTCPGASTPFGDTWFAYRAPYPSTPLPNCMDFAPADPVPAHGTPSVHQSPWDSGRCEGQ